MKCNLDWKKENSIFDDVHVSLLQWLKKYCKFVDLEFKPHRYYFNPSSLSDRQSELFPFLNEVGLNCQFVINYDISSSGEDWVL